MITQAEYNILVNKNNVLVSQVKSLKETIEFKEEEYDKIRRDGALLQKKIREFCEPILAKDRSEMDLSGKKTWSDTGIIELISKTEKAYKAYEKSRTELLGRVMDDNEQRREEIESLKQQINMMLLSNADYANEQDLEKAYNEKKATEKAKTELEEGAKVQTIIINEDDEEEYDEEEQNLLVAGMKDNSRTITGNVFVSNSKKKEETKNKLMEKAKNTSVINLNEKMDKFTDLHWKIFERIGQGHSRMEDISSILTEEERGKIRYIIQELQLFLVSEVKCKTPIKSKSIFSLLSLTVQGMQIYKERYNKDPKRSERDIIKAEHTSYEHGYTIYYLADRLKAISNFKNINIFNRSKPIPVRDGNGNHSFIPDIMYEEESNGRVYKNYIEYETGDCQDSDLNEKIRKMFYCTNFIQIIVPNKEQLDSYTEKVKKYAIDKEEKNPGGLRGKHIRLCTVRWFYDIYKPESNTKNEKWEVEFNFDNGIEPVFLNEQNKNN